MKKKILLIFALLTVSCACFAGCTDNGTPKKMQKPEDVKKIVTIDDEENPADETDDNDKTGDDKLKPECPDGNCRHERMPRPRHKGFRPMPTKNPKN